MAKKMHDLRGDGAREDEGGMREPQYDVVRRAFEASFLDSDDTIVRFWQLTEE
jgi:hypothetical protein